MTRSEMNIGKEKITCSVCGDLKMPHQIYCTRCELQKSKIESMRKQRKRDAAFGNVWQEAGIRDD